MLIEKIPQIQNLSFSDKLVLVEELWDKILESPENVPLSESHKMELDQRLEEYKQNPEEGSSWEEVKQEILSLKEQPAQ